MNSLLTFRCLSNKLRYPDGGIYEMYRTKQSLSNTTSNFIDISISVIICLYSFGNPIMNFDNTRFDIKYFNNV